MSCGGEGGRVDVAIWAVVWFGLAYMVCPILDSENEGMATVHKVV